MFIEVTLKDGRAVTINPDAIKTVHGVDGSGICYVTYEFNEDGCDQIPMERREFVKLWSYAIEDRMRVKADLEAQSMYQHNRQ
jgi:hypothetical protein